MNRRNWFWFLFFILALGIAAGLATSWNLVLFRDYDKILEMARQFKVDRQADHPWLGVTLGSLGFFALICSLIVFFYKMQKESTISEAQRNFLSRVSHELKTPIATLELTSGLLRKSDPENEELWNAHQQELRRLKEQVSLLLESSRIQSEHPKARFEFLDVHTLLESLIEKWKIRLGSDWTLVAQFHTAPIYSSIDPQLFNLMIDNLIDNAVKFSNTSRTLYVRTQVNSKKSPAWTVEIQDLGIGFDAKEERHLFKRFYRGQNEHDFAIPGNGLGLFLAQSSAKAMGLRISAHSSGHGKGATFKVSS